MMVKFDLIEQDPIGDTAKEPIAFLISLCEGRCLSSPGNYCSVKPSTPSHLIPEGKQDSDFCITCL